MRDDDVERLLDLHGYRYWLPEMWRLRLRVWRCETTQGKPHGIRYALNLHDGTGERVMGYDNAHPEGNQCGPYDHYHPFDNVRKRAPYIFVDGDTLIADFFSDVEKACNQIGLEYIIIGEEIDLDTGNQEEDDD